MALHIDIWSDIACPWCYIGKRRFESALAGFAHKDDVTVTWHSYQLDPSLPRHYDGTEVDYLVQRKGMAAEQVRQMTAHVAEQAAGEGLTYDFDSLVVANSLRAHHLLHVAARAGVQDEVKEALLDAHFVRGLDIGDDDVLVAIGGAAGVDEATVRAGLEDPEIGREVQGDFDTARSLGIQGVPFFVLDMKYAVSGAQPAEVFTQALEQAWREGNPLQPIGGDAAACGPDGCAI
ncbi:DsbA family oxidoreductase [Janibacter melonis]|uniref:DsbA family oxidoreductase n=1 Tax=Janibacter melonis TaxID=262209 RepID=UPI00178D01CB|nr:DsbA family oxidoreductase [Janibacter melonis]MCM3553541.1 DsbA family oxidoreductase [Janibacter melonis]